MKSRVLLTGAGTLIGAEVLRELITRPEIESIRLLLPVEENVRRRMLDRLEAFLGPLPPSVSVVSAALEQPRFGLSVTAWDALAASIDTGIHCARRETPDQDLGAAREANVLPVESWIQLLALNRGMRLHHLSTAFVAGDRRGLFTEFDLNAGQGFHNAHEQSAFEAEVRLRESAASERVSVHRPSHVLGSSTFGAAFEFGGAYPLLAVLAAASVLPGDGRARIDFVCADYVAKAMVGLLVSGAIGTFHLASGWHESLPVEEAAALVAQSLGRSRGASLLPRAVAWPLRFAGSPSRGGVVPRGLAFNAARDLLHQGPVFDTFVAGLALKPLGIERPVAATWLGMAVARAEERSWKSTRTDDPQTPSRAAAAVVVPLEKKFHRIGDVDVAYRDVGEGEPVVFLHGIAGAQAWDGVVERIATRRRALIVETLGIGDSTGPASADYTLVAQAARVRGLLSALGIAAAHVVGNDTGGLIAQVFAVRWPQCVKSLVLSDCNGHGALPRFASMPLLLRIPGVARIALRRMSPTRERVSRFLETVSADGARRTRFRRFVRAARNAEVTGAGRLTMPALVIWGGDNQYWSPSWGKKLADSIPGTRRMEVIPFAGISCHEEQPERFARVVGEFLGEVAERR
jgi:pimeloyl-ACP methyl ester carboxylesterase/nucleoside-diphosphate-sugar epimerase